MQRGHPAVGSCNRDGPAIDPPAGVDHAQQPTQHGTASVGVVATCGEQGAPIPISTPRFRSTPHNHATSEPVMAGPSPAAMPHRIEPLPERSEQPDNQGVPPPHSAVPRRAVLPTTQSQGVHLDAPEWPPPEPRTRGLPASPGRGPAGPGRRGGYASRPHPPRCRSPRRPLPDRPGSARPARTPATSACPRACRPATSDGAHPHLLRPFRPRAHRQPAFPGQHRPGTGGPTAATATARRASSEPFERDAASGRPHPGHHRRHHQPGSDRREIRPPRIRTGAPPPAPTAQPACNASAAPASAPTAPTVRTVLTGRCSQAALLGEARPDHRSPDPAQPPPRSRVPPVTVRTAPTRTRDDTARTYPPVACHKRAQQPWPAPAARPARGPRRRYRAPRRSPRRRRRSPPHPPAASTTPDRTTAAGGCHQAAFPAEPATASARQDSDNRRPWRTRTSTDNPSNSTGANSPSTGFTGEPNRTISRRVRLPPERHLPVQRTSTSHNGIPVFSSRACNSERDAASPPGHRPSPSPRSRSPSSASPAACCPPHRTSLRVSSSFTPKNLVPKVPGTYAAVNQGPGR